MAPFGLTSNDTHDINFPPVLYYVAETHAVWGHNDPTSIEISAPDSIAVRVDQLSDFDFCASVKNSLDPQGIVARGAHKMANFVVLYSSREFAIQRAKEKADMKVFMLDPKVVISSASTPALYDLDNLIDLFETTHLAEFQNHWEGEYYVDEAGCYLALDHIGGRRGDASVATYAEHHDNFYEQPLYLTIIAMLAETEYSFAPPTHNRFIRGVKPLGKFYCSKARNYAEAEHFPTNPTTTNGRSKECFKHKSRSWKAENPTWPRDAGLENWKDFGRMGC